MIKKISILLFMLCGGLLSAQESAGPEMADKFRQDGKIYVVIAVIAIIFASVAAFLFYIEKKLGRVEKHLKEGQSSEKISQPRH